MSAVRPLRATAIINRLVKEAPLTPWRPTGDPVSPSWC